MNNNIDNITELYKDLTYFDQYSGSVILFFIITIVVILFIIYFHIMIQSQPIINDWQNQRCKPYVMPFAGLINRPDNMSASDFTSQNFTYCTQNILKNVTGFATQPLSYVTNILQSLANALQTDIQSIRGMFNNVRTSMQSISEEIMGRLINVMIPLMQMIISFKDLISKMQGTMTASVYTLFGGYYTLKSLMGAIAQFIIIILIALSSIIAGLWLVPITWGAAAANTAIFTAIAVPMAVILTFMSNVLHINTKYKIPKVKCFDKNTKILMNDGSYKYAYEINEGDILQNCNRVTAKITVETKGSVMYSLGGVIVSDSHIVKYGTNWITVAQHPSANKLETYNEPYLYCFNTSQKIIIVNNIIFTDWDELYSYRLFNLMDIVGITYPFEIHTTLDCGVYENTCIKLQNNTTKFVKDIKINDILENGEKVYGIVVIDGVEITNKYIYKLRDDTIVKGHINDLNKCSKMRIFGDDKLYHLLTDMGTFKLNDILINDYNNAVDRYFVGTFANNLAEY